MEVKRVVYLAGAIRGEREAWEEMREIARWLSAFPNVEVFGEHVGALEIVDRVRPASEIERRDIIWLDQATHVIAEISGASTGTGREIEYARTKHLFGKVKANILCVYRKEREFHASPMIRGMDSDRYPNIVIKPYMGTWHVLDIIMDFLDL